jgi:hypothetical protein
LVRLQSLALGLARQLVPPRIGGRLFCLHHPRALATRSTRSRRWFPGSGIARRCVTSPGPRLPGRMRVWWSRYHAALPTRRSRVRNPPLAQGGRCLPQDASDLRHTQKRRTATPHPTWCYDARDARHFPADQPVATGAAAPEYHRPYAVLARADSSMVERLAVNQMDGGSTPSRLA